MKITKIWFSKKIFFSAAYTYTDSKELDSNRQYQDEVRRPKHIGSLSMSWDKNDILSFNANLRYNGSQKDFAYPNNVKLADYIIVNINASLKINKNLDAYIRLENLFNSKNLVFDEKIAVASFESPTAGILQLSALMNTSLPGILAACGTRFSTECKETKTGSPPAAGFCEKKRSTDVKNNPFWYNKGSTVNVFAMGFINYFLSCNFLTI